MPLTQAPKLSLPSHTETGGTLNEEYVQELLALLEGKYANGTLPDKLEFWRLAQRDINAGYAAEVVEAWERYAAVHQLPAASVQS